MKTKEQIMAQVETYLNKTSLHVFQEKGTGTLLKIIPFKNNGKLYYVEIKIRPQASGNPIVAVNFTDIEKIATYYDLQGLPNAFKRRIFPQNKKHRSIPNFKEMRRLTELVKIEFDFMELKKVLVNEQVDKVKIGEIFKNLAVIQVA